MSDTKRYTPEQVAAVVADIMVEEFEVEPEALRPDARLGEDLGLDSLDGVDMVVAIEKAFRCRIGEQEARSIRTLGDIHQRILSRLGEVDRVEGAA